MAVQINVAANQAALTASIQAGVQAYNQRFAQNNPINLSINQRAFSQPLGRMTGDVKDFEAALAASNARVIAFGASTAVLGGVIRSFKELANVTIDVEKNLADINRVFGLTTSQLQKFSTDLFSVGKQTASSFDDASKAALEFSRQGLKAEEVLIRTKDALTLARVAGISTANSVDALTSTINGFAATGVTTTQILNKLVAVEQDFAVGAGDLAEALSRTGQAAQEAGVSLDQLNALVTAAQQSTARGGAVIGNALKTIFTRLQRTETLDQLEAFNIAVRDVQGNTLPAVTVLQNFAGAYKNLGDAQRAQLSEQVAGVYQVNILKAIVGDLNKSQGVYAGALQRGASATNEAEVATAKLNQTLDALLKQTATSTQQLANNIGKVTFEPLARYGTEQLKSLVESMNEILEGEGIGSTFANGLLKGIRNVIAGPGAIAAFFTLFKLIQNSFTYLAQALPQIAGITTETQNRKNIEQSILQIMQQQGPVSQALAGSMGNQAAQAQLLLQLARQQTAEYQIQSTLAKQLATQLAGQGVRVKGSGGLQATRAGGYIPNATRMAEAVGAQAGGYAPGKVVKSPVGGVMNTAEDVKYVPGFAQPFINPPAGSKAGRAHRQNSINRTGVDPYIFSGFIPNFVNKKDQININRKMGRTFEARVGDDIGVPPSLTGAIDFKEILNIPDDISKGYYKNVYNKNTFADAHSGNGHDNATLIGKVIRHLNLNYNKIRSSPTEDFFLDSDGNIILDPDFVEIIGKGSDKEDFFSSKVSSLKTDSKSLFLQGLVKGQKEKISKKNISLGLFKDKVDVDTSFSKGFIPNFAIPVDSARIPWFKKYASSYKNTASDKDIFRQIDFPTYGKGLDHSYAKIGNPDMVSFLYEDFVRSAMNIALGSKQVVRSKEAGFKNTPTNAISNRDPIDLAKKLSGGKFRMLEVKQSKDNQKQTISQISDAKLRGLFEENPELAKNVELMSIIFNDPKYVDPTGKSPDGVLNPFEQSIAPIVKNSYANVDSTMRGKLGLLTDGLMRRYQSKKNSFSKGFVPNFAGKDIATKFFKTKTGPDLFSSKGTGLSGTVYRQPGYRSSGYQLKEQLNNMVMSILGNNVFFPDASSLNPKIYGDVNKGAENSAKTAALKLSSGGKTSSLGLGAGMMSEAFGNSRYVPDREAVFTGQVSGKMKRVNYDRLSDILGAFWSANPETKSAWESLKNTSETGKFEEKQNIRVKTSLLKKAYEDFLVKNNYIGTRVKLNSYRKRAEGVEGVNYGALRSDLAGVSNVRNIDKYGGFIPNFAYKQAVMGLEESMSGNKAIFDTKPFPHIRNKSQPTFSSAISDHGGLGNALSDSMRGQKDAGLMSKGYVPNFATLDVRQSLGSGFNQLTTSQQTQFLELNRALSQLARNTNLTAQQQNALRQTIRTNANALEVSTGSTRIVSDANRALAVSLQQNSNAQQRAARAAGGAGGAGGAADNSRLQKFSEGLSKASTAISIAGPMLAGFIEQAVFGDRKRTEMTSGERMGKSALSTGLSSATTGFGIGSSFGLPGAVIGGAIGGLVGLITSINAASLSLDELTQLNAEKINKDKESLQSASSYIDNQKRLNELIASGASDKDIKEASQKLTTSFNDIKNIKLAEIFAKTGGSVERMSEELNKFTEQVNRRQNANTALSNLQQGSGTLAQYFGFSDTTAKKGVKKPTEVAAQLFATSKSFGNSDLTDLMKTTVFEKTNEKIKKSIEIVKEIYPDVEQTSEEFENLRKAFSDLLFGASGFNIAQGLEKFKINDAVVVQISNFKKVATQSFAEIFRKIERDLNKNLFDIALSFEKDSSTRRIQSSILDFSTNFQDSINSFVSSNLPDIRKFDFAAVTAGQKAQMLLQKSQQDYDKAIAEQNNEKSNFSTKTAQELSGSFKSTLSNSQVNAEFYKNKVLPQIQSGNYSGDISGIISGLKEAQLAKVKETRSSAEGVLSKEGFNFGSSEEIKKTLGDLAKLLENPALSEENKSKIVAYQQELINLQETSLKFANQAEQDKLSAILTEKAEARILFEEKQANIKKELEINKQLNEAKIAVDKDIAIEKAKVDKQILMRMESMKDVSAQIGNTLELSKANINASIAALQSNLEDSRQNYGKGSSQILERKIDIQDSILKQQRELEDQTIKSEIQQRILQMAAEQENTAATLELNKTIMTLIETQLRGALGGQQRIEEIGATAKRMGTFAPANIDKKYGTGTYAQYQALQRIQESRTASASINSNYNTSNFAANMETAGFNKTDENGNLMMSTQEQINFLSKEELKAKEANNIVLEGTIKRYKEEIRVKEKSLSITRDQLDKSIALKNEENRAMVTFGGRLSAGFGKLSDQADNIIHNLAEELPMKFADNMSSALMEVAKGTKSIGDAFQDMAINFGQMIMQEVMRAAIAKTLGNIGIGSLFGQAGGNVSSRGIGYQHGGVIRANNGQYVSGMGSGDRYPAMLENGEYVLNRKAVKELGGKKSLDTFNFQQAPRFASGGNVNMEAEMALNKDQEMDYTKNLLYNNSNIGAINENNYTAYAYSENDYFKKMREKAITDEQTRVQKAFAKKQKNAQLISSTVGAVGSLFLGAGMSGLANAGASGSAVSSGFAKAKPASLGSGMGSSNVSSFSAFGGSQRGGMIGFNSGGFVPHGSRLSDTIPALLTGGEYVMNNSAVRKYGLGAMNSMNAGAVSNNSNSNATNTNNNTNNNATNISINIDRSGKATYGSDTNSYEKNDIAFSKQMAKRVADIAKGVISDETRYGGKINQR